MQLLGQVAVRLMRSVCCCQCPAPCATRCKHVHYVCSTQPLSVLLLRRSLPARLVSAVAADDACPQKLLCRSGCQGAAVDTEPQAVAAAAQCPAAGYRLLNSLDFFVHLVVLEQHCPSTESERFMFSV